MKLQIDNQNTANGRGADQIMPVSKLKNYFGFRKHNFRDKLVKTHGRVGEKSPILSSHSVYKQEV